jgi:hypothetical protein
MGIRVGNWAGSGTQGEGGGVPRDRGWLIFRACFRFDARLRPCFGSPLFVSTGAYQPPLRIYSRLDVIVVDLVNDHAV